MRESVPVQCNYHGQRGKMSLIAVYIPCKDEDEARAVAQHLLKERLIACAGQWPIESQYHWQGSIAREGEVAILAKSISEKWAGIKAEAVKVHSYDLPAIVKFDIETNEEYEKWLRKELT